MDLKKAMRERRLRSALSKGDGRALLDFLMESDHMTAGRTLRGSDVPVGPALADAIRAARDDEELQTAVTWAGLLEEPVALQEVRSLLTEGPAGARSMALSSLLTHGTPDDAEYIAERLTDRDERLRNEVYEALSQRERIGGADALPSVASEALAAERARRVQAEATAFATMLAGPMDGRSAATALVRLCDEIDATYADPMPPDASARRESLRDDIAKVGRAAYEQGERSS